ncbi:MAG: substrate-binding domain-containing protein [Chloroflexota bacterium]
MNTPTSFDIKRVKVHLWLLALLLAGVVIVLIWFRMQLSQDRPMRLVVYAFSTQEEVFTQGIFPAFEQAWEAESGEEIEIDGVFGPSGTLSLQITRGAPADVAVFSNQRHLDWLKYNKSVRRSTPQVLVASTALVIVARPGNPAHVAGFADLAQPGLRLLHGDPGSSGVGEWSVLAEYGSAFLATHSDEAAKNQLEDIWRNVRLVGSSARATLTLFELGAGDALVTYEQDAYLARQRGVPLEIIMPARTILARHYAVIVDENVTRAERPVVEAFLAFLQSDAGQQIFRQYFSRPAGLASDLLPELASPFTEEDLGGWTQAYNNLIEDFWKIEIEPALDLDPADSLLVR